MIKRLQREAMGTFSEENPPFIVETLKLILNATADDNLVGWKIKINKFAEQYLRIQNYQVVYGDTKEVILEKILVKFKIQNQGNNNELINELLKDALSRYQIADQLILPTKKRKKRFRLFKRRKNNN